MNSGSALKVIRSSWLSWIVPSISPSVRRMIHRIFSPSLDPQRIWFALNDEFCVAPPRKFCSNFIFDMFPEEVCRVNIVDLQDENGGPVPLSWFNKGAKAAETLYAGTTFAVLVGNQRRKNPSKGEIFKSVFVQHLRRALNRAELLSRAYDREFQSSILHSTLRSNERCINATDDLALVDFKPEPSSVRRSLELLSGKPAKSR